MFSNKLTYYHGTSAQSWETIKKENQIIPRHGKKVGQYWITKGAYFVCENPYIALWYAHVAAMKDNSKPVVLSIEYAIDGERKAEILNLLTADGHKALAIAHKYYKEKMESDGGVFNFGPGENLDSVSLELFMATAKSLRGVIAFFQEGQSFQSMQLGHQYNNPHVPEQKGFSPGDHVEICFYPKLDINEVEIKTIDKEELLSDIPDDCDIWPLVCNGLSGPLKNDSFKEALLKKLKEN